MSYELAPASEQDEPWLESLRRAVYGDLFEATFGGWDELRHRRQFEKCLRMGSISLVLVGGRAVGMVQLLEGHDEVKVEEIQIHPSHQSCGLGSRVLGDVIAAAHQNHKSVRLSVGLENERANRLYRRLGFQEIGRDETHHHMACDPRSR